MIRRAEPNEAGVVSRLMLRSKAYWGYDADFMERCRDELTVSAEDISDYAAYVVEDCGRNVVGFARMVPLGPKEAEIDHLFVAPGTIRKGYGRMLVEHVLQTARTQGINTIKIVGDPHAEAFYLAIGARRVGETPSTSTRGRMLPVFAIDLRSKAQEAGKRTTG